MSPVRSVTYVSGPDKAGVAEREGFEPPIPFQVWPLSRRLVSTTHAPLRFFLARPRHGAGRESFLARRGQPERESNCHRHCAYSVFLSGAPSTSRLSALSLRISPAGFHPVSGS